MFCNKGGSLKKMEENGEKKEDGEQEKVTKIELEKEKTYKTVQL